MTAVENNPSRRTAQWWERLGAALSGPWAPRARPGGGYVHCEPDWSWHLVLSDHDLWCVLDGVGRARLNGRDITLTAGCVLMLRPGDEIDAHHDPRNPLTVAYQHYSHDDAGQGAAADDGPPDLLLPRQVHLDDLPEVRRHLDGLARIRRRPGPDASARSTAALVALLLEIHAQAARAAGDLPPLMDRRVHDVVEWLARHPTRRLDLHAAAASAELSADQFSRLFRRETGQSFRAYQVTVRIDRARELLAESGMTVSQVARVLGYADHRLFVRQFKARTGTAPGIWKRSA
ncbi:MULTISPECIES: helix-turn-helix domain-containing protein [unclassified Streptomyces]|uniref:helix-turn-helix domain-containing protein n=1 Tax=unclassified Streptomyces TaxID=2593676 RepID=UPI0035DFB63B